MIRIRGKPVSDMDAGELARWLRATATVETGIAARIDRAIDAGGGLVAANPAEARAILGAIAALQDEDPDRAERLEEISVELHQYLNAA